MPKVKQIHSAKMTEPANGWTVQTLDKFLDSVPFDAKISFRERKSYQYETGTTPGYVEATWEEEVDI
jgi:hypothetical protein